MLAQSCQHRLHLLRLGLGGAKSLSLRSQPVIQSFASCWRASCRSADSRNTQDSAAAGAEATLRGAGDAAIDPDKAIVAADALCQQALEAQAQDMAVEDTLYALERSFQSGGLPADVYLKQVGHRPTQAAGAAQCICCCGTCSLCSAACMATSVPRHEASVSSTAVYSFPALMSALMPCVRRCARCAAGSSTRGRWA